VPDVIQALVLLGTGDPELEGVTVADGPQVTDSTAPDWLIIGFDGDPSGDFEAAQSVGDWSGLGTRREEELTVTVAAIANRGDTDVVAARQRVYEIGERVAAWLAADPSLGLPELQAAVGAARLVQDQTDQGAQARLLITVVGRAFM